MPKKTYEELLGLKKMQEIALERLHPPMAPKPVVSEKSVSKHENGLNHMHEINEEQRASQNSTLAIDFSYLTNNSSFQRSIIEFIKKFIPGFENVNPRGSKKEVSQNFNQNVANYREVMKELKAKLHEKRGE